MSILNLISRQKMSKHWKKDKLKLRYSKYTRTDMTFTLNNNNFRDYTL